ncbi:cytochrome P450 monooxygenase [Pyrenophora seminiperda CCB06]|uniref:Cytochrome P450 monooxygenase n=1 Tax=Pyrenophora seminiperda CCB06 TaxID=1302712 RepID=A0A3M7LV63_9PLEO|nr:cytochrome P450 monooxygenase [Pyrenophora seminiperda CCB06]
MFTLITVVSLVSFASFYSLLYFRGKWILETILSLTLPWINSGVLRAAPNVNLGWFVEKLLGQAMGLLYGPDWKRLRKIFDPAFTHAAAVTRIDGVVSAARQYVEELPQMALGGPRQASHDQASYSIPVQKAFTKFSYFLTAKTIYGPMTREEETELWQVTEKRVMLNQYWVGGGIYRFETTARLHDKLAVQRLEEFIHEWHDYNVRIVDVRRRRGESPPIITYWEELEAGNISSTELLQTLDELLMLNLDVITHVTTWFITLMATHEQATNELREEIATYKDDLNQYLASTSTHLHRSFLESMRIRPFAIFTIGESSSSVKNFHGVLVKPNTQVLVDVLAINVRNPFWGPNSEAFDPGRLKNIKPSDVRKISASFSYNKGANFMPQLRYNLHSFGIGSRKCMGQFVAGHIVKSLVVHLFDRYDVQSIDENKANASASAGMGSWTPKSDAVLRLTRRDGVL